MTDTSIPSTIQNNSRIKVLLHSASLGGVKRHIDDLVRQIDMKRFEIIGAFPDAMLDRQCLADESNAYIPCFKRNGLEVYVVETPVALSLVKSMQAVFTLARLMRLVKPDVLHCHSSMAGAVGRLATLLWRPRLVVYTPHLPFFCRFTGIKRSIFVYAERVLLLLTDKLIAVSPSECHALVSMLGDSTKIIQINHSIPADLVEMEECRVDDSLLEELGLEPGTRIVLSTARLAPQKDVQTLIRAAAILSRTRSDFVVLIAGEGEQREEIEEMLSRHGLENRVLLLGWRDDVKRLLEACDVFVLSTRKEGLPYAMLEAMALEKPVVASDVCGVSECIRHAETGFLFPEGDEQTLARYLEKLLDDKKLGATQGKKGRCFCLDNFSPRSMIEALEDIYSLAQTPRKEL